MLCGGVVPEAPSLAKMVAPEQQRRANAPVHNKAQPKPPALPTPIMAKYDIALPICWQPVKHATAFVLTLPGQVSRQVSSMLPHYADQQASYAR